MNKKNKIVFFGCSMRGGQNVVGREELAKYPEIIEELGYELASKHQTEKGVLEKENMLKVKDIHDRDYRWLKISDLGVFEISNPSLGVGAEISDLLYLGKPIICLYKKSLENNVSAYIRGKEGSEFINTGFECCEYDNLNEVKKILKIFFEKQ